MRALSWLVSSILLAGCAQKNLSDLEAFVRSDAHGSVMKVEPLPTLRPLDDFTYDPSGLPDPFQGSSRQLSVEPKQDEAGAARSLTDYPLESLRVAGILQKGGIHHALIATPENRLYLAKRGDRIGQNRGVVVAIHDKGIEIAERVRNSLGQWIEAKTSLEYEADTGQSNLDQVNAGSANAGQTNAVPQGQEAKTGR